MEAGTRKMSDDLVMRSVYLLLKDDAVLRQLATLFDVTRSDLIRSAVHIKLTEWLQAPETLQRDWELTHERYTHEPPCSGSAGCRTRPANWVHLGGSRLNRYWPRRTPR